MQYAIFRLLLALCGLVFVHCVSVKIDGFIDLGRDWKYGYTFHPVGRAEKLGSPKNVNEETTDKETTDKETTDNETTDKETTEKETTEKVITTTDPTFMRTKSIEVDDLESPDRMAEEFYDMTTMFYTTKYIDKFKSNQIYRTPGIVKDDNKINEFTLHVFKQTLRVFDEIKKKANPGVVDKVDFLARSYEEKFRTFVNDTLNHKIKTRLGSQKVILNTIDTSNKILKRIVNYFIGDMKKEGVLRNNVAVANIFQREIDRERILEYQHVCQKFGICRTTSGFTDFLQSFLNILIKADETKIKQATDAITEVLKETRFRSVMDSKTRSAFVSKILSIERFDAANSKVMYLIAKNLITYKNQPIKVVNMENDYVNKTVALMEILDDLDKAIPATEENVLTWNDLKNSLLEWSQGKRKDILDIMQSLVTHVDTKGFQSIDVETADNMNDKFKLVVK